MSYVHADGTEEDERERAARLAQRLYEKLREGEMSHAEATLAMDMLFEQLLEGSNDVSA